MGRWSEVRRDRHLRSILEGCGRNTGTGTSKIEKQPVLQSSCEYNILDPEIGN